MRNIHLLAPPKKQSPSTGPVNGDFTLELVESVSSELTGLPWVMMLARVDLVTPAPAGTFSAGRARCLVVLSWQVYPNTRRSKYIFNGY